MRTSRIPVNRKSQFGKVKRTSSQSRITRKSRVSETNIDDDASFEQPGRCECIYCKIRPAFRKRLANAHEMEEKRKQVLKHLDEQIEDAIKDLEELVRFKSVSVEPELLKEGCKALEWVTNRLAHMKFRTHIHPIFKEGVNCLDEPPSKCLLAQYFSSPTKSTLLIYAHVDVVPAQRDCWNTDPFQLHARDGQIYGRGVTGGKGMLTGWLQAIKCWLKVDEDLPINIKFIVDMLHTVGSTGLQDYIKMRPDFFLDVDFMVFDANSWLNADRPVIPCSLSGWAYFGIECRGANKSLEAGLAGGLVYEPMTDLCQIMNRLVNDRHEIQIPHIESMVRRPTTQEWHLLQATDLSVYSYKDELEIRRVRNEGNKVDFLHTRWCRPALTMHGVEGSDHRSECSRVLPMNVMGKFSIKLVPDQELVNVHTFVKDYIKKCCTELEVSTKVNVYLLDACEPTSWPTDSRLTRAVKNSVSIVYQRDPILTTSIPICLPIANVFRKILGKPIILMPYSRRKDRNCQENEAMPEPNFFRHSKVCATLFYELSLLPVRCKCDIIYEYCNLRGVAELLAAERGEEDLEPVKKSRLADLLKTKKSVFNYHEDDSKPKPKKGIKDYLCLPFSFKKPKKPKKRK